MRHLVTLLLLALPLLARAQSYSDYRRALVADEGYRTSVYHCRGVPHVGIGHRLAPGERYTYPLTNQQVEALFKVDLERAIAIVHRTVPSFPYQPKEVKLVLVGMVFNLGETGFIRFRRFRAAIDKRDYFAAAYELRNSLYHRQLPARTGRYLQTLNEVAYHTQRRP